jgi:hypothetical protein
VIRSKEFTYNLGRPRFGHFLGLNVFDQGIESNKAATQRRSPTLKKFGTAQRYGDIVCFGSPLIHHGKVFRRTSSVVCVNASEQLKLIWDDA